MLHNYHHHQPNNHQQHTIRKLSKQDPEYSQVEYVLRQSLRSVSANILRMFVIQQNENEYFHGEHPYFSDGSPTVNAWINVDTQLPQFGKNSLDFLIENESFILEENGNIMVVSGDIREHVLGVQPSEEELFGENEEFSSEEMEDFLPLEETSPSNSASKGYRSITQFIQDEGTKALQEREAEFQTEQNSYGQRVYTLLMCSVALGRCFSGKDTEEDSFTLPNGYDSVHVLPSDPMPRKLFCNRYIIFDGRRILPKYVVIVDYEPRSDEAWKHESAQREMANRSLSHHESIINNAYLQAIEALNGGNTPDSDREQTQIYEIQNRLHTIEERRQAIVESASLAEEQIKDVFRKTLVSLHDLTQLKLSGLLRMEVELRKCGEELHWMDQFIRYARDSNVPPVNFLEYYAQFSALKRQRLNVIEQGTLKTVDEELSKTLADIELEGEIRVTSKSQPIVEPQRSVELHDHDMMHQEEQNYPFSTFENVNNFASRNADIRKKVCAIQ